MKTCKYCGDPLPPNHRVLCGSRTCARAENAEVQRRKTAHRKRHIKTPPIQRPVAPVAISNMTPEQIVATFDDVRKGRAVWV